MYQTGERKLYIRNIHRWKADHKCGKLVKETLILEFFQWSYGYKKVSKRTSWLSPLPDCSHHQLQLFTIFVLKTHRYKSLNMMMSSKRSDQIMPCIIFLPRLMYKTAMFDVVWRNTSANIRGTQTYIPPPANLHEKRSPE